MSMRTVCLISSTGCAFNNPTALSGSGFKVIDQFLRMRKEQNGALAKADPLALG
jgi:hypothetical protein